MSAFHVPTWPRQRSAAVNETRQAFAESSVAWLLGVHVMFLHGLTPAQRHFQGLLEIEPKVKRSAFDGAPPSTGRNPEDIHS